jgi:tRNA(fMet)-specific endonuclease VapC
MEQEMILCDTNILIEVYKGNEKVIRELVKMGQQNIAISDVTSAELLFGARNKEELKILKKDLEKLTCIPINSQISNLSVQLVEKYSLSHKLTLPDALIAATAIVYGIELFTLNLKDFKFIKQVKLLDVF